MEDFEVKSQQYVSETYAADRFLWEGNRDRYFAQFVAKLKLATGDTESPLTSDMVALFDQELSKLQSVQVRCARIAIVP